MEKLQSLLAEWAHDHFSIQPGKFANHPKNIFLHHLLIIISFIEKIFSIECLNINHSANEPKIIFEMNRSMINKWCTSIFKFPHDK